MRLPAMGPESGGLLRAGAPEVKHGGPLHEPLRPSATLLLKGLHVVDQGDDLCTHQQLGAIEASDLLGIPLELVTPDGHEPCSVSRDDRAAVDDLEHLEIGKHAVVLRREECQVGGLVVS